MTKKDIERVAFQVWIKKIMKKIIFPALIIGIVSMASTCRKNRDDCNVYYTIKNNSNQPIYFIWNIDSSLSLLNYPPGVSPAEYKCEANTQKSDSYPGCIEYVIDHSLNKMMYIFIFDAQTIETVPWDTLKKNYMILKRYSLTKEQLDSANWTINYP